MKRIFKATALALAAAAIVGSLSACSSSKNTFTVGFDQDFPPYGYVDENGDFTGFDIEMAKECGKRMGKEVKLQPIDWDAKDMELSSGTIDCIWNGFTINERENDYTWSKPYMDNKQIFVVRKDSGIVAQADLKDKTVTAQTDSAALNALNSEDYAALKATFKQLLTCSQYNQAFMELESGAVDAIAMDIGVAKYQMEGKEDTYMILDEAIIDEQYGVGFLKGNTALCEEVEKTLKAMVDDGFFKTLSEKYFGYDVCTFTA